MPTPGCGHRLSNADIAANVPKEVARHISDIPAKRDSRVAGAGRAHKRDAAAGLRAAVDNFPGVHHKGVDGVLEEGVVLCEVC
jgi:hypothetical protein